MDQKTEIVWFTTKGQVVIPKALRKRFGIEEGTRAIVLETPEGILLKPITATSVKQVRGILKGVDSKHVGADQKTKVERDE